MRSEVEAPNPVQKLTRLATPLAIANLLITVLVLASPVGIGNGSGVIGYSVVRMLVYVFFQVPIAIAGIAMSFVALSRKLKWRLGLLCHVLVIVATLFLYFAQSQTIERFL